MDEFLSMCNTEENEEEEQLPCTATVSQETALSHTNSPRSFEDPLLDDETPLDPSEIQKQLEALERKKQELIKRARATVFGPENKREAPPKKPKNGPKLVDLDFAGTSSTSTECTPTSHRAAESDDEYIDDKKELNEVGKLIQKQLDEQEEAQEIRRRPFLSSMPIKKPSETNPVRKPAVKETIIPTAFDNHFQLRIRNPKISSETFDSFIQGFKRVRISEMRSSAALPKDGFVTVGVVVARDMRKSSNDKDYAIWKLHDLKNCQDSPICVLLFGDAYKEHWKSQIGVCVALVNPHVAEDDRPDAGKLKSKSTSITLKTFKRAEIIELGYSSDLGMCKGVKFGGQKCGNFVNTSLSEFCVHHIMNEARKLSANRGAFNSVTSLPPIKRAANPLFVGTHRTTKFNTVVPAEKRGNMMNSDTMHPTTSNIILPAEHKTTTKVEEKAVLRELISDRAHMLGARNLVAAVEIKSGRAVKSNKAENQASMSDFIKTQEASVIRPGFHGPQLGFGLKAGQDISLASKKADAAKMRAVAVLNREKAGIVQGKKAVKRQADKADGEGPTSKASKLTNLGNDIDLNKLLQRKSIHEKEANKAQGEAVQKHLDMLEHKEKVETFVTECMSVKNVKVVSCKKCDYTAHKQSDLCKKEGHEVKYSTAEKRFYKCKACKKRVVTFGLLPTKSCKHCKANDWERVAMKDERVVKLDNENLLLRGEERKYVNI